MKKIIKITFFRIFTIAMLLTISVACNKDISVSNVVLSQVVATLEIGDTLTLTATVFPKSATNKALIWSSSDIAVATVSDGKITAVSGGVTNIIVTSKDGNKTDICAVMVSWNTELFGVVNFATAQTWTVGSQIWSDAVETSFCSNKTYFDGGYIEIEFIGSIGQVIGGSFNIDCRSNPGQKGDFFSWRAVSEFKDELCPAPWRVPTAQDFINLDIALGGTGGWAEDIVRLNRYLNDWGGVFGGSSTPTGSVYGQGLFARYWSQSEHSALHGQSMEFYRRGSVWVHISRKNSGQTLRCVRDIE